MGFIDWFTFKSKEEREADERRYRRYVFPYGDKQREAVAGLIAELMPKEPASTAMAVFLICKEGHIYPHTLRSYLLMPLWERILSIRHRMSSGRGPLSCPETCSPAGKDEPAGAYRKADLIRACVAAS